MDAFIYSLNSTVPIFLTMIVGWLIKKLGIINDEFANKANKYVFKVALPLLLYKDLAKQDFYSSFDGKFVLYCALTTFVVFTSVWIATVIFMKDRSMRGAFIQGSCRSSAAILGMAFIQNMYQDVGMAPLMIIGAVPLFNIFSVIILDMNASDLDMSEGKRADAIKKTCINILKNPIIIGIVLGTLASLIRLDLPLIIDKTIDNIAVTATPVALICIGAGFEGRKALAKIKPTILASFIKLILLCAIFLPIAVFLGFRNQTLMAALIMLGSPTTVTAYIMAKNMKNDEVLSSSIIVMTTFFSSLTLTGWIFVLRMMGMV